MKHIIIAFLVVAGFTSSYCQDTKNEDKELKGTIKVRVDGLSCPFCAYGLEKKLKKMDGVEKIEISVEDAYALLTIEDGKVVSEKAIRENVKDAGFTAREITEVSPDE
jgi:mercuric ion binding protein